jgi:hypothetical protein
METKIISSIPVTFTGEYKTEPTIFFQDILIDSLLRWCDENYIGCKEFGQGWKYKDFTFGDLKELLTKIRDSEYYKSLKR